MWRNLCLGTVATLCLFSCDCMQSLQCMVIDAETGRPMRNVTYYENDPKYASVTDSTGYFYGHRISNGFTCRPRLKFHIGKEGYQPEEVVWRSGRKPDDTIVIPLKIAE
ncbi:hypothetical protein [Sinomicrobium sp. M5D2P17]